MPNRQITRHPYVSPVYGDYSQGFPPTLIQGGTREIFLSNFVRHYRALDDAGVEVELDLYEGMPHVFQGKAPGLHRVDHRGAEDRGLDHDEAGLSAASANSAIE